MAPYHTRDEERSRKFLEGRTDFVFSIEMGVGSVRPAAARKKKEMAPPPGQTSCATPPRNVPESSLRGGPTSFFFLETGVGSVRPAAARKV